jgi:hypothetical protein
MLVKTLPTKPEVTNVKQRSDYWAGKKARPWRLLHEMKAPCHQSVEQIIWAVYSFHGIQQSPHPQTLYI